MEIVEMVLISVLILALVIAESFFVKKFYESKAKEIIKNENEKFEKKVLVLKQHQALFLQVIKERINIKEAVLLMELNEEIFVKKDLSFLESAVEEIKRKNNEKGGKSYDKD